MMTLYAHASSLKVKEGQTVKKGDVIALVGSTGWSTGNHLHFTVYKNGVAVNPQSLWN
jgi:murein DD-endopeptidase MepM/ murein hydrolase activator NlpD